MQITGLRRVTVTQMTKMFYTVSMLNAVKINHCLGVRRNNFHDKMRALSPIGVFYKLVNLDMTAGDGPAMCIICFSNHVEAIISLHFSLIRVCLMGCLNFGSVMKIEACVSSA